MNANHQGEALSYRIIILFSTGKKKEVNDNKQELIQLMYQRNENDLLFAEKLTLNFFFVLLPYL
jgi:hypothetical protein